MLGAIIGDILGSPYEHENIKTKEFNLFSDRCRITDDTILTCAIADAIVSKDLYGPSLMKWGRKYPFHPYGQMFKSWLSGNGEPYNSYGNGSAMRVSPVAYAFNSIEEVLFQSKKSAEATHNHPEGIKGAQAVAAAVFYARNGKSREEIKGYVEEEFGYNLKRKLDDIRPFYRFDPSCQGTVPEAIIAFLESTDFEDAIRNAVSIGGDSDTITCITGSIAEAFYKDIPKPIKDFVFQKCSPEINDLIEKFHLKFGLGT
jgi:ADP-ribosylglycohydrolase